MLKTMLDAHFWANHVMLDALEKLTPEQWTQPVPSSFPTIHDTVVHMLMAERFLFGNFQGERLPKPDDEAVATLAGVKAVWAETEELWRKATANLDEAALQRPVTMHFANGQEFPLKAWQIIHQLIEHGPYHRGQVITQLHQVGGRPFKTDVLGYHIMNRSK